MDETGRAGGKGRERERETVTEKGKTVSRLARKTEEKQLRKRERLRNNQLPGIVCIH